MDSDGDSRMPGMSSAGVTGGSTYAMSSGGRAAQTRAQAGFELGMKRMSWAGESSLGDPNNLQEQMCGKADDAFDASMPPLETKKARRFSEWRRGGADHL